MPPRGARHIPSWLTRNDSVVVHPGGTDSVDQALGKLLGRDSVTRAIQDKVFPGGTGETMASIRVSLNRVRQFRNRIFHHEPVWHKRETDASPDDRYGELLKALRWLGGGHAQIVPALHDKISVIAYALAVPDMATRLIRAVDDALERAKKRKEEKAAVQAARPRRSASS